MERGDPVIAPTAPCGLSSFHYRQVFGKSSFMFSAITGQTRRPQVRRPICATTGDGDNMIGGGSDGIAKIAAPSIEIPSRFKLRSRAETLSRLSPRLFKNVLPTNVSDVCEVVFPPLFRGEFKFVSSVVLPFLLFSFVCLPVPIPIDFIVLPFLARVLGGIVSIIGSDLFPVAFPVIAAEGAMARKTLRAVAASVIRSETRSRIDKLMNRQGMNLTNRFVLSLGSFGVQPSFEPFAL